MKPLNEANEKLVKLMFKGIDHGVTSIEKEEGLLITFAIIQIDEELKLARFATERIEDGQIQAEAYLKKMDKKPNFAIIAFDGIVTIENKEYDAIIIEGFDKNDATGYVLAQRFKRKTAKSKFEAIGNAAYLGNCRNILK
jgi:hypothetical protein